MKLIVITGTPGTGKTTLAKYLEKQLGFFRLDLHDYYNEISASYNKKKKCYDVNLKKLEKLILNLMKKHQKIIFDSHIAHLLPKKLVDLCVVLTCSNLKLLEKRLQKCGYSRKKIRENLDAEIFQVCLTEAQEKGHKVVTFDTSKMLKMKKILEKVKHFT